jgi:hypothetical protein
VNPPTVYRRGEVLWRRTGDSVVVLVLESGEFVTLQASGCDLWDALAEPGSLGDISERLAAIYGAPADQIASDIGPTLEQLERCGALVVTGRSR